MWPRRIAAALVLTAALMGAAAPAQGASLQYFGGPIMHANTTALVDWGSSVGSTYTSGDPGFLTSLAGQLGSPANVSGILAQYLDTSGQNYHSAAYDNQYAITPASSSTSVTDSQIQTELKAQVNAGHLPSPGGDGLSKLYVVLFPSGTTVCTDSTSCSGGAHFVFCAYHGSTQLNASTRILYAVMPDETGVSGCTNDNTAFNSHTVILSHEWAEAINDPLVAEAGSIAAPLAWYDSVNGEIGDICNQQPASNGSIRVQKEFSNLDNNCVSTEGAHYGSPTAAFSAPSGAVFGQQASFSGSNSSDPSGNHASVTFNNQTHTIPSGIASWTWAWGDGTANSTGVSPSHTFAAAGNYNVTLTVKDNLGFTAAVTHQVSVGSPSGPVPTITTGSASGVGVGGATLNGTVNPNGTSVTYHFEYGTSSGNYDHSTANTAAGSGSSNQNVSADVSGLAAHTQYFFRLVGQVGASTYPGQQMTFTTGSPAQPLPAPLASVVPASDVGAFAATLNGSVDPRGVNTTYRFDYGTSSSYGSSTPDATAGSGSGPVAVSYAIPSLAAGTTYHYRVVASSAGGTAASPDATFTTGAAPPSSGAGGGPGTQPPVTPQPGNVVVPKLTLAGSSKPLSLTAALKHGLRYRFKCDRACTVTFTLTFQLPPGLARVATSIILAKGTAKLKSAGKGVAVLRFNRSGRKALAHKRTAKLWLTGTARDSAGRVSKPGRVKLVLRR